MNNQNDIPRTPDDAMIRSWIASLELKTQAVRSDWDYNVAVAGDMYSDDDWEKYDAYVQQLLAAKFALKALLLESE